MGQNKTTGGGLGPQDPFKKRYPIIQEEGEEGFNYTVYIHDSFEAPNEFTEMIDLLVSAERGDKITFVVNSGGGYLASLIMLRDAIKHTKAFTLCECAGVIASAATMLALSCKGLYIAEYSEFMIHYYSGGSIGKGNEIASDVDFQKRNYPPLFREIYNTFLTEDEITDVIRGHDIYLTAEEVKERWLKVIAIKDAAVEEQREVMAVVQNAKLAEQLIDAGFKVTPPKKKVVKKVTRKK